MHEEMNVEAYCVYLVHRDWFPGVLKRGMIICGDTAASQCCVLVCLPIGWTIDLLAVCNLLSGHHSIRARLSNADLEACGVG